MNWLQKTPTELFKNIPTEVLEQLISEKKHTKQSHISNIELLNHLMSRHILNKHHVPFYVSTHEDLKRWLFCIYVIE